MDTQTYIAALGRHEHNELVQELTTILHYLHIAARSTYRDDPISASDFVLFNETCCRIIGLIGDLLGQRVDMEQKESMLAGIAEWASSPRLRAWLYQALVAHGRLVDEGSNDE